MIRHRTPHYGPHKGVLCREELDGTLTPVEVRDTSSPSFPVVMPAHIGPTARDVERQHREAMDSMAGQLVESGHSNDDAREIARTAARRATGEHGGNVPFHYHKRD